MICAYMLWCGLFQNAHDALEYFAQRRTSDGGEREGVEVGVVPSPASGFLLASATQPVLVLTI